MGTIDYPVSQNPYVSRYYVVSEGWLTVNYWYIIFWHPFVIGLVKFHTCRYDVISFLPILGGRYLTWGPDIFIILI